MRLYEGPFRSKSYEVEKTPLSIVNRRDTYTAANGTVTYGTVTGFVPPSTEAFSSLYAPNFHKLVQDGWVIQTPFTLIKRNWSYKTAQIADDNYFGSPVQHTNGTYDNTCTFAQLPWLFSAPADFRNQVAAAADEVMTRVYAKAATPQADLLIEIAQLRETLSMFVLLGKRFVKLAKTFGSVTEAPPRIYDTETLRQFLNRLKRRVRAFPVQTARELGTLSGWWCEMRYGWRPLLSSLEGVVDALNDPTLGSMKRVTYRALEDLNLKDTKVNQYTSSLLGFTGNWSCTTETSFHETLRGGILLERTSSLAKNLGLELDQIPIAMWDLVPYSFIIDRFVNVGNYIRSLRPVLSTGFGGSWLVERFEYSHIYRGIYPSFDYSSGSGPSYKRWVRKGNEDEVRLDVVGHVRTVRGRPHIPVLRWDWASINDLFNAVDGIMLVIQRLVPAFLRSRR